MTQRLLTRLIIAMMLVTVVLLLGFCGENFDLRSTSQILAEEAVPSEQRDAASLVERLLLELEALRGTSSGVRLLYVPLVVGLGWLISRGTRWAIRLCWRFGLDRRRRLAVVHTAVSLLASVLVVYLVLRRLFVAAPLVTMSACGVILVAVFFGLSDQVQNLAAGLGLTWRNRVREGDQVAVGNFQGIVREVGITTVSLRTADNSTVHVPNRLLNREAVVVDRARHAVPVQVTLCHPDLMHEANIRTARRIALMSPYRNPDSSVRVSVDADESTLRVELQTWATRDSAAAEHHLRRALERAFEPLPVEGPDGGPA